MKSTIVMFLAMNICFLWCTNPCTSSVKQEPRTLTDQEKRLVQSCNQFGFRLLAKVNQTEVGRNVFVSPFSVSTALGMALNGADGMTESAMLVTLGYAGTTKDEINGANYGLMQLLRELDPKVQLSIANSLWYRRDFVVEPQFIEVNRRYYEASVRGLNFGLPEAPQVINSWVDTSTHGKIQRIVPETITSDVVMYLINAIYFKGTWKYQFDKRATIDAPFYLAGGSTKQVKLMRRRVTLPYTENAGYQAIELPYGDSLFTMVVVLPKPKESVETFVNDLTQDSWKSLEGDLRVETGTILLPRFKLEFETGLNEPLKEMGMGTAFDRSADFTGISRDGGLCISEVRHKTFVQVDEEGTVAAAVTSVRIGTSAYPQHQPFVMRVDRPFFFAITERHTGELLFVGKVVDPE